MYLHSDLCFSVVFSKGMNSMMNNTCFLKDFQTSGQRLLTNADIPWWVGSSSKGPDPYEVRKGKKRSPRKNSSGCSK